MGLIDKLTKKFGDSEVTEEELQTAPLEEDVEQELQKKEQQIQQLRQEVQNAKEDQDSRTARLEEKLQRKEQELREKQEQFQSQMQQIQNERSTATVQRPPPDNNAIKGNPVVSPDGRIFGAFERWINERDKIGIQANHPKQDGKVKIGWADTVRDLVVDPSRLAHKDAIVVKFDSNGEPMDFVPPSRYQEIKKKKDRIQQEKRRVSGEADELKKQLNKLRDLNQKLITLRSMDMIDKPTNNGSDEMVASKIAHERQLDKQRMDRLSETAANRRRETEQVIHQYEDAMEGTLGKAAQTDMEQSFENVKNAEEGLIKSIIEPLQSLDAETREDLLEALGGSGGGGGVTITDE